MAVPYNHREVEKKWQTVWDDEKVRKTSPSYIQFPVLYPGTISGNCRDHKPVYENWFSQLYYCRPGVDSIFT